MQPELNKELILKDDLKDNLLKKTGRELNIPASSVEKVINFIFKDAAIALKTHRDVELTGFGIFKTNNYRGKRLIEKKRFQIKKYQDRIDSGKLSESGINNYKIKIESLTKDIENIEIKMKKPDED